VTPGGKSLAVFPVHDKLSGNSEFLRESAHAQAEEGAESGDFFSDHGFVLSVAKKDATDDVTGPRQAHGSESDTLDHASLFDFSGL